MNMSTHIEINGDELVPLKLASKKVSYSRDYLSKLARENKIIATQTGRQWFIDMHSLKNFIDSANLEQEVRKQQLRTERRMELLAKKDLANLSIDLDKKIKQTKNYSLTVSLLILLCGVSTGSIVYSFSNISKNISSNNTTASSVVAKSVDEIQLAEPKATTLLTTVTEYPLFTNESSVRDMNSEMGGVLLLTEGSKMLDNTSVENMFSDNVSVEFKDDNTGVIKLNNDTKVTEIPFISVPSIDDKSIKDKDI